MLIISMLIRAGGPLPSLPYIRHLLSQGSVCCMPGAASGLVSHQPSIMYRVSHGRTVSHGRCTTIYISWTIYCLMMFLRSMSNISVLSIMPLFSSTNPSARSPANVDGFGPRLRQS